ncbi:Ku protein [Paracoccus sp. S-4012]|uniref:non-homologous end joining protein Ku n=1 Tax=Paracoccus sp. S-4012 TaxID=2665648 RepID=UPI0012B110A4|nr:Ku protein [Paracoccus sp. S-4012]MRX51483.1 Ku protein [Paracoccus sp. S-4012]
MASRAIWKGQLRLSLVSIPIEIHSATQSGRQISFRQIHGPTGKPIRYEKTVPGVGPVKSEDILKGYEIGDNEYMLLKPEEIDAIKLETKKTFELVQFVGSSEIPPLYFEKPYYMVPTDDLAEDAYRVVRDALRRTDTIGLGQLTLRGRENLCAVKPCGDGLLMETLYYADEIRSAEPLFSEIGDEEPDDDLLAVATQLIKKKTAPFNAEAFTDHYDKALRALIEEKRKSGTVKRARTDDDEAPARGTNVIDLMAALKASLKGSDGGDDEKPARGKAKPSTPRPKAKPPEAEDEKPARKTPARKPAAKKTA